MPIIAKLFKKSLLNILKPIIGKNHLILDYQFRFREKYNNVDQVYRITDITEETIEEVVICFAAFLDKV